MTDDQSKEETPESDKGIEFDYGMAEDGTMHTALVVTDPGHIRRAVSANIQWIPTRMGDGPGAEYPGFETLEEQRDELPELPILVVTHVPAHIPPEEAAEQVDTTLYLVQDMTVTNMIGSGINMFTGDHETTNQIMHLLFHLMGGEHDEEEECKNPAHDHSNSESEKPDIPLTDEEMVQFMTGLADFLQKADPDVAQKIHEQLSADPGVQELQEKIAEREAEEDGEADSGTDRLKDS